MTGHIACPRRTSGWSCFPPTAPELDVAAGRMSSTNTVLRTDSERRVISCAIASVLSDGTASYADRRAHRENEPEERTTTASLLLSVVSSRWMWAPGTGRVRTDVKRDSYLMPDEAWPRHPRNEAQRSLERAAAAGWSFRKLTNHAFGRIVCPAIGDPDACSVIVLSTSGPRDGSWTAKVIDDKVKRCRHGQPAEAAPFEDEDLDRTRSDDELERRTTRLLEAAEGLRQRAEAEAAMEWAADEGDDATFDRQDERHGEGDIRARTAWAVLGRPFDPWPPEQGIEVLLDEADVAISGIADVEIAERLRTWWEHLQR